MTKLQKYAEEIESVKSKISRLQARLSELETEYLETEKTELYRTLKLYNISIDDMKMLAEMRKNGGVINAVVQPKTEPLPGIIKSDKREIKSNVTEEKSV
ncbi:hypothetical protein FACS1894120_3070 [Clostridia bacterium]|nr:hypothetical protein FACS1894120_3070 [Clostridia bacterium]